MNNKILVNIYVTSIDKTYDVYIAINERIDTILKELTKVMYDLADTQFDTNYEKHTLINRNTGKQYALDEIIINTEIRNGTQLILI